VSPRPSEIPSADAFAAALRTARDGRYDDAINAVRDACAGREEDDAVAGAAANALARIGRSAEAAERWEEAERAIAAGLALRPRYPDLHHQQARLLLMRGRRPEARRALEQALTLHPGFVAARVDRALLDAREGRIGEALQELRELAKEARVEEPPAFERGLEHLREADVAEAGVWLSQALRLSDPILEERLEHARRLLEEGEIVRAAQLIREMLPAYALSGPPCPARDRRAAAGTSGRCPGLAGAGARDPSGLPRRAGPVRVRAPGGGPERPGGGADPDGDRRRPGERRRAAAAGPMGPAHALRRARARALRPFRHGSGLPLAWMRACPRRERQG